MRRAGNVVLLYHRIANEPIDPLGMCVSPQRFEEQLEALARVAPVVPAGEIPSSPPGSVAITFDDGYADVFDEALPRLEACGMPGTVFLVARQLENGCGYWWDRLASALFAEEGAEPMGGTSGRRTPSVTRRGGVRQRIAMRVLFPRLRAMSGEARESMLRDLERDSPIGARRLPKVAQAGEVRSTCSRLLEIGSHTLSHAMLSAIDASERRAEIADSRLVLEDEVAREVRAFAYPFGARGTFTGDAVAEVEAAGYACAFTNIPGSFRTGDDVFRIPRRVVGNWSGPTLERRLRRWLA
jgi:peptidoglycan/xylan/chitin deacetylase (PgdA/CDA1 family)